MARSYHGPTTHPPEPIGGGQPQFELYFALDPAQWRLGTAGRVARLYTFPAIGDWSRYEVTDLTPGTIALIPAGTGHRGCDVFAHIVTLPGFKPGNELYLDRAIRDATAGASPHNPALAAAESASAPPSLLTRVGFSCRGAIHRALPRFIPVYARIYSPSPCGKLYITRHFHESGNPLPPR